MFVGEISWVTGRGGRRIVVLSSILGKLDGLNIRLVSSIVYVERIGAWGV